MDSEYAINVYTWRTICKKCKSLTLYVVPSGFVRMLNVWTSFSSKCLIHTMVEMIILSNFLGIFNNHFCLNSSLLGNLYTILF